MSKGKGRTPLVGGRLLSLVSVTALLSLVTLYTLFLINSDRVMIQGGGKNSVQPRLMMENTEGGNWTETKHPHSSTFPRKSGLSHNPLESSHDPLENSHNPLERSHDPLESPHNPLESSHDPLESSHNPLERFHDPLESPHDPLESSHDPLESSHRPLEGSHNPLKSPRDPLKNFHDPLESSHSPLERSHDPLGSSHDAEVGSQKEIPFIEYHFDPSCQCKRRGRDFSGFRESWSLQKADAFYKQVPILVPKGTYVGESSCNDHVTSLGAGQNVVAYSYYVGRKFRDPREAGRYTELFIGLASRIKEVYPGWRMRVYTNVTRGQPLFQQFCDFHCDHANYSHVDICQVANLPKDQYHPATFNMSDLPDFTNLNQSFPHGMFWRFMAFGDPTVNRFLVRDLDSYILDREVAAVKEWVKSEKGYHIMRDAPFHTPYMTGNFGVFNYKDFATNLFLKSRIFSHKYRYYRVTPQEDWGHDKFVLRTEAYPFFNRSLLLHASYKCGNPGKWGVSRPFPTRRVEYQYVGYGPTKTRLFRRIRERPCPLKCRPKDHQDWEYC